MIATEPARFALPHANHPEGRIPSRAAPQHPANANSGVVPLSTRSWNQIWSWLENLEKSRSLLESAIR